MVLLFCAMCTPYNGYMARGRGIGERAEWAPLRNSGAPTAIAIAPDENLLSALDLAIAESEAQLVSPAGADAPPQYKPLPEPLQDLPMSIEQRFKYSTNAVLNGAGLNPGDHLVIEAKYESAAMAVDAAMVAYQAGAKRVSLITDDVDNYREIMEGLGLGEKVDIQSSTDPVAWAGNVANNAAFLTINHRPQSNGANNVYWDAVDQNDIRWSVTYWPTQSLAESVYGNDPNAKAELAQDLLEFARCGDDDAPNAPAAHIEKLYERSAIINSLELDEIIISNGDGSKTTSFGLLNESLFRPCHWQTSKGESFGCNVPTEEIFCTPDPTRTNGTFRSVRPFQMAGVQITAIEGEFKDGILIKDSLNLNAAVDASVDLDELKDQVYGMLESNPGMLRVGELALIGEDSRIGQSKRVYGIDSIDENVGCHFALGESYLAGVKDFADIPERNRSSGHIDITFSDVGTKIFGITRDGRKVKLMDNGQWQGPLA